MSKRAILAGLLGGVAMYLWSALAHMVLPLGAMGIQEIPNEQPVLAGLHAALGESHGMYIYPGLGPAPDAMQQYEKKLAANPSGLLIYHPPGASMIEPGQLATEFVTELLESLLAVFLLAQTGIKTWRGRAGFVTMAGVLAAMATNIS